MEQFHTKQDLAKRFNRTPHTIRNWIKSGRLRAVKVAGTVLIPESAVQEMLAANVQTPTIPAAAGLSDEARDAIAALVKAAPTLTPEKITKLRLILADATTERAA